MSSLEPKTELSLRLPTALRLLCLPVAAALVLSLFSAAPSLGHAIPPPWDKLAHLAFYGTIGLLVAAGLRPYPAWLPFLLTCACGAADETYQSFLPGREAGLDDFSVDVVAAALATWLAYRILRK